MGFIQKDRRIGKDRAPAESGRFGKAIRSRKASLENGI